MNAAIANLKVRSKIFIGFGLLLASLAAVGGLGVLALQNIDALFNRFQQRATVLEIADKIEMGFIDVRRHAQEFGHTGNMEEAKRAEEVGTAVKATIETGLTIVRSPERQKLLQEIRDQFGKFMTGFQRLMALKKDEAAVLHDVLDPSGLKLRQDFDELAKAAARAGNSNAQLLALGGLEALMVARLDAIKALAHPDEAAMKKAEASFVLLFQSLKGLDATAKSPELKPLYDEIKGLADKYQGGFKRAADIHQQIDKLINGDMRGWGRKIAADVEAIVRGAEADMKADGAALHALIGSQTTTSLVLGFAGLVVGVLFAWAIGRMIAEPVVAMTGAMGTLASGNLQVEIPALGRKDEIGLMA